MDEFSAVFQLRTPISDKEALGLHPMALAFVGDAAQSLYVRTRVTVGSSSKTGALHKKATQVVKAVSQSAEAEELLPLFDEVESEVFRRARNCKPPQSTPRLANTGGQAALRQCLDTCF